MKATPNMLTLYHAPSSVCSIKVRLALAEIGLDFAEVVLNLPKGEQHRPDYLAINPEGVVPTLIDDDLIITESSLIVEYLDREYNEGRLMPADRRGGVVARGWLLRALAIHGAINTLTFSTANRDATLANKTPDEIAAALVKMPDPVSRLKRADLLENGLSSPYVGQALIHLRRAFADMSAALATNDWVTGAAFGISDIALLSYVDRLERLGFAGLWSDDRPQVGAWLARMQARDSYAAAVTRAIDADDAAKLRAAGGRHWPALRALWRGA